MSKLNFVLRAETVHLTGESIPILTLEETHIRWQKLVGRTILNIRQEPSEVVLETSNVMFDFQDMTNEIESYLNCHPELGDEHRVALRAIIAKTI